MAEFTTHAAGTFCWIELATSDPEAAKRFYAELFGWGHKDDPMGPDFVYTTLLQGGKAVGALYRLQPEEASQGMPPHWGSYVRVADLDATAAKVAALGGQLLAPPMDVMSFGRMAVFQDPTGAVLSLWQPTEHHGAQVKDEPISLCWAELMTRDTARARDFYGNLFDWGAKQSDHGSKEYTEFTLGKESIAGMMPIGPEMGPVPPNWMIYFAVSEIDALAAKAAALGGKLIVPPQDIPKVGRFAVIQDPQGAVFGAIRMG
jgi:predicted enzyme related to lactoylglutathione lyase